MSPNKSDRIEVTLQDGTIVHGLASDYWATAIYAYFAGGEVLKRLATGDWQSVAEVVQAKMDAAAQQKMPEAEAEVEEKLKNKDADFLVELDKAIALLGVGKKTKKDARTEAIALLTERTAKNSAFGDLVTALLGRSFNDPVVRKNMLSALCSVYHDLPSERYSVERNVLNPQVQDLTMLLVEAIAKGFESEIAKAQDEVPVESTTVEA